MSLINLQIPGTDGKVRSLPKAYGGCKCWCHRHPGVLHCVPCCYPGKPNLLGVEYEDGEVYRRRQTNEDILDDTTLLIQEESGEGTEFGGKDGVNFDRR